MDPIHLDDLRALAKERLPPMVWDYYAAGAFDERTLRDNEAAWGRLRLVQRVLNKVGVRELTTSVIGQKLSFPVLIAPTAMQAMAHPDGELATARAAARAGTVMVLSTLSNHPVEAVCAAHPGGVWFQLYVYKDRGATRELVARAEAAGCRALVFTVDAPVLGTRERDRRNRFRLPEGLGFGNLPPSAAMGKDNADSSLASYVRDQLDPDIGWDTLDWLRGITTLPVVIKGVAHPDDAAQARARGAAAVIVSNHGGRQLDGAVPTAELLPAVVDAAGGEVLVDGGLRRGGDVLRALALGAKAALVGRPVLWGLAVDGERGVDRVLATLRAELDETLALVGAANVHALSRALIRSAPCGLCR